MRRAGWGRMARRAMALCVMGSLSVVFPAVRGAATACMTARLLEEQAPQLSARKKREKPPRPRAPKQPIRLPA